VTTQANPESQPVAAQPYLRAFHGDALFGIADGKKAEQRCPHSHLEHLSLAPARGHCLDDAYAFAQDQVGALGQEGAQGLVSQILVQQEMAKVARKMGHTEEEKLAAHEAQALQLQNLAALRHS